MEGYEAIILAGGLGTRLRSAVRDVPKCMAPVAGRPFLWYLLDALRDTQVKRVVLSVGYLREAVMEGIDPSEWPFEIDWAVEETPLGTGGGIRLALSRCRGDRVAVLNGDTLYDADLDALIERSEGQAIALALKPLRDFDRYGAVVLEGERVTAFREKAPCAEGLVNGGVYAVDRRLLDLSGLPEKFSFEKEVLSPMAAAGRLAGYVDDGYFIDIGIPEDYARAQQELPELQAVRHVDRQLAGGPGWTLLLDRDGVINRQIKGDYVRDWAHFAFLPGILRALRGWSQRFDRILVVTNQRGVGRGLMSRDDLDGIHRRMAEAVSAAGGRIDGIYVSTAVEEDAPDRKPQPGLFEAARRDFPALDPARCVMVGDTPSDAAFARNCGIAFVPLSAKTAVSASGQLVSEGVVCADGNVTEPSDLAVSASGQVFSEGVFPTEENTCPVSEQTPPQIPPGGQGISERSRRIAKNTLFLYFRMFLLMAIGLFTSRVVLRNLGVTDVGIYNAVGGVVMMFTIVTNSLSTAISRFLTYGLGERDAGKEADLGTVFSTSVTVELILSGIIFLLVETVGLWFLNVHYNIPPERLGAANWVMQCAMLTLAVNLLSVPFNAVIVAHEHMRAFAYISVVEAVLKLGIALLLSVSAFDKLKTYAVLMLAVALAVRGIYALYCRRFAECRTRLSFDRKTFREMTAFAGWNFFGSASYLCNTQGVNIVTNLFFGVAVNAARGYAVQLEGLVRQFVTSFTTALNPQITKSYAEGDRSYCYELVCKGAKYSWLLMLLFAVPFLFESDRLLTLWLGAYPAYTEIFVPLAVIANMVDMFGNSMAILAMATGEIRRYYLIVGGVTFLVFPISWLCFALGMPPQSAYVVHIVVYTLLIGVKLAILRGQIGFPPAKFVRETVARVVAVTVPAVALTGLVRFALPAGIWRLLAVLAVSTASVAGFSWLFAATEGERAYALSILRKYKRK